MVEISPSNIRRWTRSRVDVVPSNASTGSLVPSSNLSWHDKQCKMLHRLLSVLPDSRARLTWVAYITAGRALMLFEVALLLLHPPTSHTPPLSHRPFFCPRLCHFIFPDSIIRYHQKNIKYARQQSHASGTSFLQHQVGAHPHHPHPRRTSRGTEDQEDHQGTHLLRLQMLATRDQAPEAICVQEPEEARADREPRVRRQRLRGMRPDENRPGVPARGAEGREETLSRTRQHQEINNSFDTN